MKMVLMEIAQQILNEYEFEVNGKKIKIKSDLTEELFFNVFSKICKLLSVPTYVHSYYGFIWEKNNEFLALNTVEESYGCDAITVFVFSKMPIGKKLNYNEYAQIEKVVNQVFHDHSLNCDSFVHYCDRKFTFFGDSAEMQCLLILKQNSLEFCCSTKQPLSDGMARLVPRYSRKENISLSELSVLKQKIQNCFNIKQ